MKVAQRLQPRPIVARPRFVTDNATPTKDNDPVHELGRLIDVVGYQNR
ncbi:MAG: hypothetical protein HOH74_30720 [Gemmatimonadetes bacterium]|nr:hypothetical protein [Gemmatimonadota bacterium]